MKWLVLLLCLWIGSLPLSADILHLKDGRILQGIIVEVNDGFVTLQQGVSGARVVSTHPREEIMLIRLGPVLLEKERDRALRLMREKRYSEALSLWKHMNVLEPERVEYGVGLAKVLRLMGRESEAKDLLEQFLQRSPEESTLHLELGELYLVQANGPKAIECAKAAGTSGRLLLSRAYQSEGRIQEANQALQMALGDDPGNGQIHIRLWKSLMGQKEYRLAEKLCRGRVEKNPRERKGWILLGHVLHAQENYPEAVSVFKKAISLGGPGFDRARVYLQVSEARENGTAPLAALRERDHLFAFELEPELRRNHP